MNIHAISHRPGGNPGRASSDRRDGGGRRQSPLADHDDVPADKHDHDDEHDEHDRPWHEHDRRPLYNHRHGGVLHNHDALGAVIYYGPPTTVVHGPDDDDPGGSGHAAFDAAPFRRY